MLDAERGYGWRSVGSTQHGVVSIAVVTIDGHEVPFEYQVQPKLDESGEWYDIQLGAFGYSQAGEFHWGTGRASFASEEDRKAAILLAIEGVLAWLPGGRGLEHEDGYGRVMFEGKQYRLGDFGPYFEKAPSRE